MHFSIITLFPEMFPGSLAFSLAGRALCSDIWSYRTINLRDFGITKHKNIDDTAYGGGTGLVVRPDVLGRALDYALEEHPNTQIYYPTPRGKLLNQKKVKEIASEQRIIIICARFEGIDERIIDEYNVCEFSIGDYVLSGGEPAALVLMDSVIRLVPGVVANRNSIISESFEESSQFGGLLEPPLYTKPEEWRGRRVPPVLLSGHHAKIADWKKERSLYVTRERRADLLPV